MAKHVKILFLGDVVGRLGRKAVGEFLKEYVQREEFPVFSVVNVENASHGYGLTEKNYNELSNCGFNCMTSGNHIWDKKDIFDYIKRADKLIRPINYPKKTKGTGSKIFEFEGGKIAVINALGRIFMHPCDSPWDVVVKEIKKLKKITPNILIDFHAEATAEKVCFAKFCSEFGVSAIIGTHTHVQTADEQIINGMAYITDAGFCGVSDSVIGMDYESSLKRLATGLPERYEIPSSKVVQINAVEVLIDMQTGKSLEIKRFSLQKDYREAKK
ncbi:MAG: TIGR00282 family metallophosphoesterase [Candidatus Gastranaerophilales bacterium]|nr:TIGR00282 family metallophosphoesterase [Candidatus Gastranaerophilales bacterium]